MLIFSYFICLFCVFLFSPYLLFPSVIFLLYLDSPLQSFRLSFRCLFFSHLSSELLSLSLPFFCTYFSPFFIIPVFRTILPCLLRQMFSSFWSRLFKSTYISVNFQLFRSVLETSLARKKKRFYCNMWITAFIHSLRPVQCITNKPHKRNFSTHTLHVHAKSIIKCIVHVSNKDLKNRSIK